MSSAQERAAEVLRDYFGRPLPNEGTCHVVVYGAWRYGSSNRNSLEICEALGIDPEMPVTELRRLLQAYEAVAS